MARVAVDISLPHLDRPFDYLVPDTLAAAAMPGSRVRVRFAGQLVGGFVLERLAATEHQGKLGYLERVVSPEPVLTPEIARLARAVADRYGGTLADVLRLAIPPRHAAAEQGRRWPGGRRTRRPPARTPVARQRPWARYLAGPSHSWRRWPMAAVRARSGLRCRARTGRAEIAGAVDGSRRSPAGARS